MGGCAAPNCSNHSRKGVRMVRFPKEGNRRKKWIINCRRKDWLPGTSSQLCIHHFEQSQFKDDKNLVSDAIPTLFDVSNPPPSLTNKRKVRESTNKEVVDPQLLMKKIQDLERKNQLLQTENQQLKSENQRLKSVNQELKSEMAKSEASLSKFLSIEQISDLIMTL